MNAAKAAKLWPLSLHLLDQVLSDTDFEWVKTAHPKD